MSYLQQDVLVRDKGGTYTTGGARLPRDGTAGVSSRHAGPRLFGADSRAGGGGEAAGRQWRLLPPAGRGRAMNPTILTASGHYFDLLRPWRSPISVLDIAHALAHLR